MIPFHAGASAVGDAVTEGQEADCEQNVLTQPLRELTAELNVGKVSIALDAQIDEVAGGVLGHGLGNGQHHHVHRVVL